MISQLLLLSLPSSPAFVICSGLHGLQGSQAEADQLLLDIYSSINEPDGIYAVARGHNMVSQLKLYEHEASWDRALAGYDMMCHRTASEQVPRTSASHPAEDDSPAVSVNSQQGLLTALQQLGCRHLIEAYWQGQPGSVSQGLLAPFRLSCNFWIELLHHICACCVSDF